MRKFDMTKYRFVVEHVPSGRIWRGNPAELENLEELLKSIIKDASNDNLEYFILSLVNGLKTYFSPSIIKECTISIETISES